MFKVKATIVVFVLAGVLAGCASQSAIISHNVDNSTRDIVEQEANVRVENEKPQSYLNSAVPMTKDKFNSLVEGVPDEDEFEEYKDLFDEYVEKNQDLYFVDFKLEQWNKNFMDASKGHYSVSVPMSELKRETNVYEASNSFGKKVLVERVIGHQDKVSLDKSYVATTKGRGKELKGETIRIYYTLAKSKDYILKYVDGPKAFCRPLQLSKPTVDNPQEIIMTGCELRVNVVQSVLLSSGARIKLSESW